jgi:hypothetical protein
LYKHREFREALKKGNPEPSLRGDSFEGATTKTYQLEQLMKSVEIMPISKRGDVLFLKDAYVKDSLIYIVIYTIGI